MTLHSGGINVKREMIKAAVTRINKLLENPMRLF